MYHVFFGKKLLKRFWPILFILAIWFIFASPYILKNKVPFPSTYQVNNFAPWSANSEWWGPVKNGAMPDIITQIYPWRHLAIEIWKTGQVPLWNPYSFAGTPLLANYQSAVFSPFNILFFILPFVDAWSILVLIQPLMAVSFMYLFVLSLNKTRVASLIASVSFMFCGFITVWMGYATLPFAILFLPLSLFCIEKYYHSQKWKFLLLLSISVPLSFFSGHFQTSLYFLLVILAYLTYKFLATKNIFNTFILMLYVVFGLLLSMPQILPSGEFYIQSVRSVLFQRGEVIPWEYISTFFSPDFFGNPVTRNDWFGHYAEWNAYIGVLPLMLAIYAIFSKKNTQTLFLFISGVFVLLLAFPSPLLDIFTNLHIPVLSTSSASRVIVIYSFLFTILSAFGFDFLVKDIKEGKFKKIITWLVGIFGIFLVLWLIVGLKLFIPVDKIVIAKSNLILPTVFFAISGLIIVFSAINKKILFISIYLLLLIVSFDMLRFAIKWMPFDSKNLVFPDTITTKSLSKIAGYNRTFGNLGGEASMYYHLPSVEGYDALYIKRYGELISFIDKGKPKDLNRSVVIFSKTGTYVSQAINLLDIKYIIHKLADDHAVWTFPYWTYPKDQFKLIYKDKMYEFYENTKTFPHAFLVGKYKVVKDRDKIKDSMFRNSFDLRKEIILEEDPQINMAKVDIGDARITNYKPNNVEISVDAKSKALLFLADNYYNGWKASVDGRNVSVLRADYTFKAIPIEKGQHTIKFSYDPWSFRLGVYFSIAGLIGILFMVLVSKTANRSKLAFSLQNEKDK